MSEKLEPSDEYNTFVFKCEISKTENPFNTGYCGMKSVAWAAGHALRRSDQMEEFIRELAAGAIDDPEDAAQKLMDEMNWE